MPTNSVHSLCYNSPSDIDVMTLRFTMKGHLRGNASIDNIFIDALIRC